MKILKSLILVISIGTLTGSFLGQTPRVRTPIKVPDIPGYLTLKCDFHTHTVFSDGAVWPDIRSEEAWREGLDAIAITDHIEYQPHKEDLPTNHERSFQIASPHGQSLDLLVIRGSEITRQMPPGHLNAIFLEQVSPPETERWEDSVAMARRQGAFIFWNHPGWRGQQSDGIGKWYPEHTSLVENDRLHGIEVANAREYYPEAHRWCLEKNLTMLSNSDIHNPLNLDYHVHQRRDHRPLTLVFAEERSIDSIKEALFDRRTAVYTGDLLIGEERFLRPIFDASIQVRNPQLEIEGDARAWVQIHNSSDIDYRLSGNQQFEEITTPERLVLQAGKTSLMELRGRSETRSGTQSFTLNYTVENLKLTPEESLTVELNLQVTFTPEGN